MNNLERQLKCLQDAIAKGRPRTVEDYVDDMISHDMTLFETLVVANSTRWKGQLEKIKETYHARTSN